MDSESQEVISSIKRIKNGGRLQSDGLLLQGGQGISSEEVTSKLRSGCGGRSLPSPLREVSRKCKGPRWEVHTKKCPAVWSGLPE